MGLPLLLVINGGISYNSTYVNKNPGETHIFSAISKGPLFKTNGTVVMLRKLTGRKISPHLKGGATNFTPENLGERFAASARRF